MVFISKCLLFVKLSVISFLVVFGVNLILFCVVNFRYNKIFFYCFIDFLDVFCWCFWCVWFCGFLWLCVVWFFMCGCRLFWRLVGLCCFCVGVCLVCCWVLCESVVLCVVVLCVWMDRCFSGVCWLVGSWGICRWWLVFFGLLWEFWSCFW